MDEVIISKAITETYVKDLLESMEVEVAIVGAGPSGMTAGYYLAKNGVKTTIFERKLSIGGGMWGGGMMFNRIVVQAEGKKSWMSLVSPPRSIKRAIIPLMLLRQLLFFAPRL